MERKIIWMPLFLIGILSSFQSCDKGEVDNVAMADYNYYNSTSHVISIDGYSNGKIFTLKIQTGDSLILTEDLFAGDNDSVLIHCDSVSIIFDSSKKTTWYPETKSLRNLINLENYEHKLLSARHHKYTYIFTKDDFDNAMLLE